VASYFDPTDNTHLALLPAPLRAHAELFELAPVVEADVIGFYTRRVHDARYTVLQPTGQPLKTVLPYSFVFTPRGYATDLGNGEYVYLIGYTLDAADPLADPLLVAALRKEVAHVLRWRLRQWDRDPAIESESSGQAMGGRNVKYRAWSEEPFPRDFPRWTKPFDSRPITWGLG